MKKVLALISAITIILLLIACGGESNNQESDSEVDHSLSPRNPQEQIVEEPAIESSKIDIFIEEYNTVATNPITDTVEFNVTDKKSGHYRTEFRLGTFSGAYGKTGKIDGIAIDVVCYGLNKENIRVYVDGISLEQAKEIVKIASPILDSKLSDTEIGEALDYLDENKEANGYYYGDIGIVLLGKNEQYYSLMLKVE